MAKDDYFVIVYKILSYLYTNLKAGKAIKANLLKANSPLFGEINESYWKYIIINLYKQGMIEGLIVDEEIDNATLIYNLEHTQITPEGIRYLNDNTVLEKVKTFMKDIKESVPFL